MKGLHEWKADTLTLRGLNSQTVDEEPPLRSISTVSRGKEYDTDLGCTEVSRGHGRRQDKAEGLFLIGQCIKVWAKEQSKNETKKILFEFFHHFLQIPSRSSQ